MLTLTFPINEPLEGTGTSDGEQQEGRGGCGEDGKKKRPAASDGGGAVEGAGGCSVQALSLLLLLASVQSVTRIRSKLSGWMMRLPSAGPAHREQLPPLETCLAQ